MRKKNNLLVFGILVIVVIVLVSIFVFNQTSNNEVSFRLKWFINPSYTGELVASDLGFYEEQGLNLSINPGGPDLNSVKLVASGADLIGSTSLEEVILAREKGVPIVAIGAQYKDNPSCWISLSDSGITQFEQFEGKTISVVYGDNTEVLYKAIINKLGLDRSKITEEPFRFVYTPFLEKQVDVMPVYLNDQAITIKNQGYSINTICAKDYGFNPYGNVYITTEETIKNHPEVLVDFLKGSIKGWEYVRKNKENSTKILLENMGDSLEYNSALESVEVTLDLMNLDSENIFVMDKKRFEETQDLLLSFGNLEKEVDLDKSFTNQFVNQALDELKMEN